MNFRSTTILLAIITSGIAQAQLTVDNTQTPAQLVQNVLLGGGVTASNITFNGGSATVLNEQIGSFVATATNLGLGGGVIMGSGDVNVAIGPNTQTSATLGGGNFGFNDPDLDQLSNVNTNDAAILEFDFVPTGDSLKFRYVFSSEEYDEYVCGTVNDAFGFFLSGPGITGPFTNNAINIALVPGTNVPVSINTVNNGSVGSNGDVANCSNLDPNWQANSVYFVSNNSGTTIEFDGMTVVLTARALVQCGQTYHIKLAIADGGDTAFDSGVFLEENSFASTGQVIPSLTTSGLGVSANDTTMFEGCGIIPFNFHRMGDTTNTDTVQLVIGGTATPGVDYYPPIPTQLIYQPGDTLIIFPLTVPLDADGLETFTLQVTENIVCSGQTVISNYTFYIDQYADLNVVTTDVSGLCEQDYDIGPTVTQGAGYYGYLWSTGETTPTINV
ncbi:MAG: choice-of-anchor L domain-containing protein, partial [Flavobacteriales bacterium]